MSSAFTNCKTVLVTGANRGLGLQIVESLVTGGCYPGKIIAAARSPGEAKELQSLSKTHPNIHIITLDVVSEESIKRAAVEVEQIVQEDGISCLINNAGINVIANFETVTSEKMLENFHTNSVGPLMITKAMLPMLKRGAAKGVGMGIHRAAVINMTSLLGSVELNWGERAKDFKWYPYRTSKSALNMITRCMAVDLEADGILCMAIHPGWVRTDMGGQEVFEAQICATTRLKTLENTKRKKCQHCLHVELFCLQAPLSTEESISSVLAVISSLTEKDHGTFLHYTGEALPW